MTLLKPSSQFLSIYDDLPIVNFSQTKFSASTVICSYDRYDGWAMIKHPHTDFLCDERGELVRCVNKTPHPQTAY